MKRTQLFQTLTCVWYQDKIGVEGVGATETISPSLFEGEGRGEGGRSTNLYINCRNEHTAFQNFQTGSWPPRGWSMYRKFLILKWDRQQIA